MKGIIILEPWISKILAGEKTWEMRDRNWDYRGPIALIRKGSGVVVGVADLIDVRGPFDDDQLRDAISFHRVPPECFYKDGKPRWRRAWVLEKARALPDPVPYRHPRGAVITVNLEQETTDAVLKQRGSERDVGQPRSDRAGKSRLPGATPEKTKPPLTRGLESR